MEVIIVKSLLLIIDLQQGFINNNTEVLLNKIKVLLNEKKFDKVVFTRFINYTDSILYRKLNYNGCITEESRKILIETNDSKIIDKTIYSAFGKELKTYIKQNDISKIYLCGIDTECCVLKTAFDLFENDYDVYVLKDYCSCMHGIQRHNNALEILKRNIGYDKVI